MNQQIDNALGGYEESVATVGGGSNSQDTCASNPAKPAPDTLLEQIKELRPKVTQGDWKAFVNKSGTTSVYSVQFESPNKPSVLVAKNCQGNSRFIALAPQMADRIIADAEKIERLREAVKSAGTAAAFWCGDWSEHHRLAWIYHILLGWDDLDEIATKFEWQEDAILRLKKYREIIAQENKS